MISYLFISAIVGLAIGQLVLPAKLLDRLSTVAGCIAGACATTEIMDIPGIDKPLLAAITGFSLAVWGGLTNKTPKSS